MFFLLVSGDTPLCYSAFAGKAAATRYLLDHGADPLVGKSVLPLHGAAGGGLFHKLYFGNNTFVTYWSAYKVTLDSTSLDISSIRP
jgi:ankyrin repeat protein